MSDKITYTCNGPRINVGTADDPQFERLGCGTDVTGLVEAVPEDGVERQIECPVCGTQAAIRRVP